MKITSGVGGGGVGAVENKSGKEEGGGGKTGSLGGGGGLGTQMRTHAGNVLGNVNVSQGHGGGKTEGGLKGAIRSAAGGIKDLLNMMKSAIQKYQNKGRGSYDMSGGRGGIFTPNSETGTGGGSGAVGAKAETGTGGGSGAVENKSGAGTGGGGASPLEEEGGGTGGGGPLKSAMKSYKTTSSPLHGEKGKIYPIKTHGFEQEIYVPDEDEDPAETAFQLRMLEQDNKDNKVLEDMLSKSDIPVMSDSDRGVGHTREGGKSGVVKFSNKVDVRPYHPEDPAGAVQNTASSKTKTSKS